MKKKLTAGFLCFAILLSVGMIFPAQAASEDGLSAVGVQLRMEGTQALRFIGRISTAFADELRSIDSTFGKPESCLQSTGYGFVVTGFPLPAGSVLQKDTERALVVPAVVTYDENDEETVFTVCIIGITPLRYTTVYTAVPYATYRDTEGAETTVYGKVE